MGITIVQKSDLSIKKPKAKKALILGGGAITGASFKVGGLKALNDYLVDFELTDFDLYLGVSSGALLAAALIGGLTPEEMFKSFEGTSKKFSKLHPIHFYWPNWQEMLSRPMNYAWRAASWIPGVLLRLAARLPTQNGELRELFWGFIKSPSLSHYEQLWEMVEETALADHPFPSMMELLPSGIFDNTYIEKYMRDNIRRNHLTNDFRTAAKAGKKLYIGAMSLDDATEVIFGPDEVNDVPISKAVQASTAMPGFYRPVKIGNQYYVDGIVPRTANFDLMVEKGAKLIVCYNPFRPFENKKFLDKIRGKNGRAKSLTEEGILVVLNQIFRTFFHTRLHVSMNAFRDNPKFDGDIILIEPRADDAAFFAMNPFMLGHQLRAAGMGFESVRNSIDEKFPQIQKILNSYGIAFNRDKVEEEYEAIHGGRDPFLTKRILERKAKRA